jgi:hypothetical protein
MIYEMNEYYEESLNNYKKYIKDLNGSIEKEKRLDKMEMRSKMV